MNWYKRHIGDYIKDAAHLSLLEHGVYSRLLDVYYTREVGIPDDQAARLIGARSKEEREALQTVLSEFFLLQDGVWIQARCEREIEEAQEFGEERDGKSSNEKERQRRHRAERKSLFEQLRSHNIVPAWDTKMETLRELLNNVTVTQPVTLQETPVTQTATAIHTPQATPHIPQARSQKESRGDARGDASPTAQPEQKKSTDRATRIPADFSLTDERRAIAAAEKLPDAERTFAKFRDYWTAAPGSKGRKIDWDATWRNWCRAEADRGINGHSARPVQQNVTKFERVIAMQGETKDVGFG